MKTHIRNFNLVLILLVTTFSQIYAANVERKPSSNSIEFSSTKISADDIKAAMQAAEKVQTIFTKPLEPLSPLQEKILQKQVALIKATKESLRSSQEIVIDEQSPGKFVVVKSATMPAAGYIGIEGNGVSGSSQLLPAGVVKNITITLNRPVDGITLLAYVYKDNGDGVFDANKDEYLNASGFRVFKEFDVGTKRNLKNVYYSNYIFTGSPALIIKEQVPGTQIDYNDSGIFTSKIQPRFIAIFKDKNGLPGKLIGTAKMNNKNNIVDLTEPTSNEMLYAILFKSNPNNQIDLSANGVIRGEGGMVIVVKFKVLK